MLKLIEVHDPICGCCYGFIPTIEQFARDRPEAETEVVPGSLVTADQSAGFG